MIASLVSGKALFPKDCGGIYNYCAELFDYLTQSKNTNAAFFNRGSDWCASVLGEQYPQFIEVQCEPTWEGVEARVGQLEKEHGKTLPVQVADRPFLELSHEEEWANIKGVSPEELEGTIIRIEL